MRSTKTATIVGVEELVEPDVVAEMRIVIQLGVSAIRRSSSIHVTTKDVNDTVLDLLRDGDEVHVVSATSWTFDL